MRGTGLDRAIHEKHRVQSYFRPYTSAHRSSNALTISFETCPKNDDETAACTGLANANARSRLASVAADFGERSDVRPPGEATVLSGAVSKRQVVLSSLNSGVDEATAWFN